MSDEMSPAKLDDVTELITEQAESGGLQKRFDTLLHFTLNQVNKNLTRSSHKKSIEEVPKCCYYCYE